MAAKRQPRAQLAQYVCPCGKKCEGPADKALALLQLCEGCQATRFAKGETARLKAEAAEVARG